MEDILSVLRDLKRLQALADTGLLDSPDEERFDQYTRLACKILGAPVSLVSLVDDRRQFFKSASGLGEPWATLRETPLSHSFCKYAVASGAPFIVHDAPRHPLVHDNAAVHDLGVIAYAGVPLKTSEQSLGVFCVIDSKPREWTPEELAMLTIVSSAVVAELELSRTRREVADRTAALNAITDSALDAIITADAEGMIIFSNRAVETVFGYRSAALESRPVTDLMPERYRSAHREGLARVRAGGDAHVLGRVVALHGLRSTGEEFPLELSLSRWCGRSGSYYTGVLRDVSDSQRALQSLREAEEQLRLTIENAPIGMALVSLDGRWLRVNGALGEILGYSETELMSTNFQAVTHPEDLEADLELLEGLLAGNSTSYKLEKRYRHRDGHTVWTLLSVALVRDTQGAPSFFVSQIQDISDRRNAEAQADLFFENSVDMLTIFGTSGTFERVNVAWERTLGWSPQDLISRPYLEFVHPEDREKTTNETMALYAGHGTASFRNRLFARDGGLHWLEWTSRFTEDGRLFCVARDVTKSIELETEIRRSSLEDELTGLHNRRGFMLLGEQMIKNAARYDRALFVLFADLDGLKRINDELGHEAGDRVIAEMAIVLRSTFRKSDVLSRLGGDEFVVMAEGDVAVAEVAKERLKYNIQRHNEDSDRPYSVSASIGIALYDKSQAQSLAALITSADKVMYDAKKKLKEATRHPLP
jgi:diguanylate cyclase